MKTVAVAVDVSKASRHAFHQALILALSLDAKLVAISVTPQYEGNMNRLAISEANNALSAPFIETLTWAKEQGEKYNKAITTIHRVGKPSVEIIAATDEHNADILVLGNRKRNAFEKIILGKTLEKITENSPCDVLVLNDDSEISLDKILIGISGSERNNIAAERALAWAKSYGSKIYALHATNVSTEDSLRYAVMNIKTEQGVKVLSSFTKISQECELLPKTELCTFSADKCLTEYARKEKCNLLMLGPANRGSINGIFSKNIVDSILAHAPCPVLILNRSSTTI